MGRHQTPQHAGQAASRAPKDRWQSELGVRPSWLLSSGAAAAQLGSSTKNGAGLAPETLELISKLSGTTMCRVYSNTQDDSVLNHPLRMPAASIHSRPLAAAKGMHSFIQVYKCLDQIK